MSSEEGDFWRDHRLRVQEAKWRDYERAIKRLDQLGIGYFIENEEQGHLLVGDRFDFWGTTGTFIDRTTQRRGHGIEALIAAYDEPRV